MQVELKRIQQEVGITFIYVTHDQEEAMTMSDRIAVMNKGRYEQLGDPESLYERPTTRFVAGFLGVSNLLPGTVESRASDYVTVRLPDDSRVRVPGAMVNGSATLDVGVRPEKIRLHESATSVPAGALGGFGAFLAACTGASTTSAPSAAPSASAAAATASPSAATSPTPVPSPTGPLKWAQWPAYIDLTGKAGEAGAYAPGSSPTIEAFKKQYKVDVDYEEKIEANEDFYATIQPQLQGGLPTGWDLITVTDWLAAKIISKGWAEKIDQAAVPNCT